MTAGTESLNRMPIDKSMTIYFAAPLFSQAERQWNRRFAGRLRECLPEARMILPQDLVPSDGDKHGSLHGQCVEGVEAADVIVAVLDGPDVDCGVAWEMGYAHGLGTPVVGVRTDFRESQESGVNLMCSRGCDALVRAREADDDCAALATRVAEEIRRARAGRAPEPTNQVKRADAAGAGKGIRQP